MTTKHVERDSRETSRPLRILIGKPGLDGHDRGAKYVARVLRQAGFEVMYSGIRRSPEELVDRALSEGVDVIGLSLLSGAHLALFGRVIDHLRERGAGEMIVVGGGIIPPDDVQTLRDMGVAAIFTPGASARDIVDAIRAAVTARRVTGAHS